jgi:hypothetical protein
MDRLRLQEEAEDGGCSSKGSLQPEDVAPATERDNDATNEGP